MAYCDSIMLSSPYPGPKLMGRAEDRRARVLERGNTLEPCPGCGGEAEVEPPCTVLRDGLEQMVVCRRCPRCGPSYETISLTIKPAPPILTPAPDEPCSVCGGLVPRGFRCDHPGADILSADILTTSREELPMSPDPVTPTACECGCGEPAAPGKRFATLTCGKRWAGRQGKGAKRAKSARRSAAKPGECSCGCEKPPLPGSDYASSACRKRAWRARRASSPTVTLREPPAPAPASPGVTARQVLDYLLGLTQEQRAALADVVAAEEACARLGVVL